MTKKTKLIIVAALVVVAGLLIIIEPKSPAYVCAPEGVLYSGLHDSSQNDCPITDESYKAVLSFGKERTPYRVGALVLGLTAVGFAVSASISRRQ